MFDLCNEKTIKVILLAQQECRRYGHGSVGSEHLLLGLIGQTDGLASRVLREVVTVSDLREKIEQLAGRGMKAPAIEVPFTPKAKQLLSAAVEECERRRDERVDPVHLLFAMLPADNVDENAGLLAVRALEELGVDCPAIKENIDRVLSNGLQAHTLSEMNSSIADTLNTNERTCSHCAELIKRDARVCRFCLRSPDDHYRRCDRCAEWIQARATFCRFCQSKVDPALT